MRTRGIVKSAMPSFTNPNNVSIITGVPPSTTGICGNYFYDRENDQEIMMNSAEFLRCGTILQDLERSGSRVVVVTAKNKLLQLLTHGLDNAVGFSVEKFDDPKASKALLEADLGVKSVEDLMGRPAPDIYDPDISIYCLEAGFRLIERMKDQSNEPIVAYLSTTDFVQHKYVRTSSFSDSIFTSLYHTLTTHKVRTQ
jgi:phosphonoacetate hydrolase